MAEGLVLLFMGAPPPVRCRLMASVLSEIERGDPGFERCLDIWRNRKSVRVGLTVDPAVVAASTGGADIAARHGFVHLILKGGRLPLLRHALDSLNQGRTEFGPGRMVSQGQPLERQNNALLATFDGGTLVVTRQDDDMVVIIDANPAMTTPTGFAIGEKSGFPQPTEEGARAVLFNGQLYILFSFADPQEAEIRVLKKAQVELALLRVTRRLAFIAISVPGLMKTRWAEVPFSIAIEKEHNRALTRFDTHGRLRIILALIDYDSNVVQAARVVAMPRHWSERFEDILVDQLSDAQPYDHVDYDHEVDVGRALWTDLDTLPAPMVVVRGACLDH